MNRQIGTRKAAERLGITQTTLRRLASRRAVPHWRIGTTYRFDPDELDAWVTARRVTVAETAAGVSR